MIQKHIEYFCSTPTRALSCALSLVAISSALLIATNTNSEYSRRHYAISSARSSVTTTNSEPIVLQLDPTLITATDALSRSAPNPNSKFLFKSSPRAQLIGKGVTAASSEFMLPTTQLSVKTEAGEIQITDRPVEYSNLSPDGTKAIYTTSDKKTYLYDIATKTEKLVTSNAAFLPDLCRDNNQIVYKKLPPGWQMGQDFVGSPGLAILDITTGVERLITTYDSTLPPGSPGFSAIGENSYAPTFSPDCQSVVFFGGGMINSMFIVNADGTNKTQLTNVGQTSITADTIPGISDSPLWSPDGTTFIYESDGKIIRTDIDTATRTLRIQPTTIANGIAPEWMPSKEGNELKVGQVGQTVRNRSSVSVQAGSTQ